MINKKSYPVVEKDLITDCEKLFDQYKQQQHAILTCTGHITIPSKLIRSYNALLEMWREKKRGFPYAT